MKALLIGLMLLGLASPAFANDAEDENGNSTITGGTINRGPMRLIYAGMLCSNISAADTNCTVFDTKNTGIGNILVVHMYDDGSGFDCDASGNCTSGGSGSDLCSGTPTIALTTANRLGVGNAPPAGARAVAANSVIDDSTSTSRVLTLEAAATPLSRYLFTSISGAAGCTNIDVTIEIYEHSGWF